MSEHNNNREAYIIYEDILPEAIKRTAHAKQLLARGEARNINEAVKMADISRSVFYKYKDGIFPFYQQETYRVVVLSIRMDNSPGRLMAVLAVLADNHCNIHTLNQDMPLAGVAAATITMEVSESQLSLGGLLAQIQELPGIISATYIGELAGGK
ncbi:MAG TPA: ACT domain-containing protein [Candidatus Avidehalobacter gallistercoris]|uniref:ACT domain-containing protein n=1 Tax=Candidatus Avidehalobacter gallistercoris TaxID=2840694 RepID=A0A9D1HL72_9FIRM|nr:ACT domain-containing protein [Candidatus Avidehalobacter gallistercoris]